MLSRTSTMGLRVGMAVCVCAAMVGDGRAASISVAAAGATATPATDDKADPAATDGASSLTNASSGRKVVGYAPRPRPLPFPAPTLQPARNTVTHPDLIGRRHLTQASAGQSESSNLRCLISNLLAEHTTLPGTDITRTGRNTGRKAKSSFLSRSTRPCLPIFATRSPGSRSTTR